MKKILSALVVILTITCIGIANQSQAQPQEACNDAQHANYEARLVALESNIAALQSNIAGINTCVETNRFDIEMVQRLCKINGNGVDRNSEQAQFLSRTFRLSNTNLMGAIETVASEIDSLDGRLETVTEDVEILKQQ